MSDLFFIKVDVLILCPWEIGVYTLCFTTKNGKNGKYFLIIGFIFISVFLTTLHMGVPGCGGMGHVCIILIDWSALKDSGAEEFPEGKRDRMLCLTFGPLLCVM